MATEEISIESLDPFDVFSPDKEALTLKSVKSHSSSSDVEQNNDEDNNSDTNNGIDC